MLDLDFDFNGHTARYGVSLFSGAFCIATLSDINGL